MDQENTRLLLQPLQWGENLDYKPADLQNIMDSADGGDFEPLADFCDWLLSDERVRSTLNTRANALLGSELYFEGENAELWQRYWTESFPESTLHQALVRAWLSGCELVNVAWEQDSAGIWWPKLQYWHLRNTKLDFRARQYYATDEMSQQHYVQEDDPAWIRLFPYGETRPWMNGTWRAIALFVLGKQLAWRDWNRRNEITGIGIVKGTCPAGTSEADRLRFRSDIASLGRNAKIILTEGFDISIEENKPFTWQTFGDAIKSANSVISIAHLGQNLTTEVDGGSYAATMAHGTVRQDYLAADAQIVSTILHDQLLAHWSRFNNMAAPWPKWRITPPEDAKIVADTTKARADSIKAMAEAAKTLREIGINIDIAPILSEQLQVQAEVERQEKEALHNGCCGNAVSLALGTVETKASPGQAVLDAVVAEEVAANELRGWVDEIVREIESTKDEAGWELGLVKRLNAKLGQPNASVDKFARALEQALIVAQMASGLEDDGE